MGGRQAVLKQIFQRLEREPRVNLHRYPVRVAVLDGAVLLEGEVGDIAAKKLALETAAAVDGVRGVIDRLRVAPAQHRGDGAIRDSVVALLLHQQELSNCTLRAHVGGRVETLHDAAQEASGEIEVAVGEGVITLEGQVISLSHKRLAGVLAWWTPGRRDVLNSIAVVPEQEDSDDEVVDALRLVYDIDPQVPQDRIRPRCRNYVVTLEGSVSSDGQKRQAELDAWYLFAVDRVETRLEVRD
jgi:osmotically-inducible protein OsmY